MSLTVGNISSHHEGHLDGDIRDTTQLGGERPPWPCHKLRQSPQSTPRTQAMETSARTSCAFSSSTTAHSPSLAPHQGKMTWGQKSPKPQDAPHPNQD